LRWFEADGDSLAHRADDASQDPSAEVRWLGPRTGETTVTAIRATMRGELTSQVLNALETEADAQAALHNTRTSTRACMPRAQDGAQASPEREQCSEKRDNQRRVSRKRPVTLLGSDRSGHATHPVQRGPAGCRDAISAS
jgi:hypothetical protein